MIRVNGQEKPLDAELLLSDFLEQEGYLRARIAVELNGEVSTGRCALRTGTCWKW